MLSSPIDGLLHERLQYLALKDIKKVKGTGVSAIYSTPQDIIGWDE